MHPMYPSPKQSNPQSGSPVATANDPQAQSFRNTQYSLQSFEVPMSLPRPSPNPDFGNFHGPVPQFLSGQGSNSDAPNGETMGASDAQINPYESELSSEQNSSGPSPGNSSSNTSYSPRSQMADQPPVQMLNKCFSFVNGDGSFLTPPSQQAVNSDGRMPSNWSSEAATATSKANPTGLTPDPDGDWPQVFDNMAWDSTLINPDTSQWGMSPGGMR